MQFSASGKLHNEKNSLSISTSFHNFFPIVQPVRRTPLQISDDKSVDITAKKRKEELKLIIHKSKAGTRDKELSMQSSNQEKGKVKIDRIIKLYQIVYDIFISTSAPKKREKHARKLSKSNNYSLAAVLQYV